MSQCIECGLEMDACEASQYEECYQCRKVKKRYHRVQTAYRRGSEEAGRHARSSRVLGGSSELPDDTKLDTVDDQG